MTAPTTLAEIAETAARRAGAVLLAHAGATLEVETKSSATDPVTEADRASEQALVEFLTRHRPDDGLLGEEGADTPSRSGLRWVVDPLDGTVNFLYGLPAWSVSVAVEEARDGSWQAVAGCVYQPSTGEAYTAARGEGATRNGRPLRVNDPVPLAQALVATGFSYDRAHRATQAATAVRVLQAARDIRRFGSAALDLCGVAAGGYDAYYEDSTSRWDWAAGALIATEAGATVTPLSSGLPGHSGLLAAGPSLHAELSRLLDEG